MHVEVVCFTVLSFKSSRIKTIFDTPHLMDKVCLNNIFLAVFVSKEYNLPPQMKDMYISTSKDHSFFRNTRNNFQTSMPFSMCGEMVMSLY